MQRDDWYETARDPLDLQPPAFVGRRAGERAARRAGARKVATTQAPVLFEAPIASSLLGHFVSAVSGGSLYRKSSFLLDSVGRQIFEQFFGRFNATCRSAYGYYWKNLDLFLGRGFRRGYLVAHLLLFSDFL